MSVEGGLPKGWARLTIAELGGNAPWVVQTGPFGAQLHSEDYVDDGVPFILIKNLRGTRLDTSDMPHISYADARRLSAYALKPGDIVFSRVGRVGSCFLVGDEQTGWIISGQMLRIRLSDDLIDKHYLLHALRSKPAQDAIIDASVGTTRQSINTQILSSLEVFVPPKEEQSAIAAVLSTIDRTIEQTEALIAKYQRIKTGLMHDLLTRGIDEHGQPRDPATHKFKPSPLGMIPEGWKFESLGKHIESSAFGPRFSSALYAENGRLAMIRTTDLDNDGNLATTALPLADLNPSDYEDHLLRKGDLLISRSGTIGITFEFESYPIPVIPSAFTIRFRPRSTILPRYYRYFFNSPSGRKLILSNAAGGVQANLKGSTMLALLVPVPAYAEQERIVTVLDAFNATFRKEEQHLRKLQRLKTGLMQDLLTGKVSVEPLLKDRLEPAEVAP